jgi:hypothetical protein
VSAWDLTGSGRFLLENLGKVLEMKQPREDLQVNSLEGRSDRDVGQKCDAQISSTKIEAITWWISYSGRSCQALRCVELVQIQIKTVYVSLELTQV